MGVVTELRLDRFDDPGFVNELIRMHGSPLLVLDCERLRMAYRALREALPGVALHYAIKALPEPNTVATLDVEGAHFDIATSGEIKMLRDLYIDPRKTIHTHPIKRDKDIRDALRYGCTTFVVDNIDELQKFVRYRERVGLLLRVCFRSPEAKIDLSKKFGCPLEQAPLLLAQAQQLGLHIKGLSFHVGSQCGSSRAHVAAVEACNALIRQCHAQNLAHLGVLDIGGGFPAPYDPATPSIEAYCAPLRQALAQLPDWVEIIAEPGRALVADAMTCLSTVIGKSQRADRTWYYLDEGVYGAFSGQIYEHIQYPLAVLKNGPTQPSVLAGPTCDSIDIVAEDIELPELAIGDVIIGRMMGAYTAATATEFNSIPRTPVIALDAPEPQQRVAYIA